MNNTEFSFQNINSVDFNSFKLPEKNEQQPVEECCEQQQVEECCEQQQVEECCEEKQPVEECCEQQQPVEECCEQQQPVEECCEEKQPVEECCDKTMTFKHIENIHQTNVDKYKYVIIVNADEVNPAFVSKDVFILNNSTKQSKWQNVLEFLMSCETWKKYDYLWFPDCKMEINQNQVNSFFNTIGVNNVTIGQPSLVKRKHMQYPILCNKQKMTLRPVNFVESMMPCFKKEFVENNLISFLSDNKDFLETGCGIDLWWSSMYPKEMFIIDTIKIRHVDNTGSYDTCLKEKEHFINKYQLTVNI